MMRKIGRTAPIAALAAVLLAVTACSSSGGGGGGSSSPGTSAASGAGSGSGTAKGSGSPIKVGVMTDTTGAASSGYQTTEIGVKAYVNAVNAEGGVAGHKLEYVMADTTSTPAGALTAAQKLVQKDDVFAIIADSAYFFGAEPYLLKEGIPVIGTGFDGPEWTDKKNTNLFNVLGVYDPGAVYTTQGQIVKKLGGTACGSIGYIESPSATKSAVAFNKSCRNAGLKAPYTNNIHFGSTDVGPIALKMKARHVDSVFLATVPSTGFALAQALNENGVKLKAMLEPQGYGSDLLKSAPAVRAAQGFYFQTSLEPIEMNTPATKKLAQRMAAAGEKLDPGYAESQAYLSFAGLARGLEAAGPSPTKESFMTGLRKVNDFDADGLLAMKVDFSDYSPAKQCTFITQLKGHRFNPVAGLTPICGTKVSGG